MGLRELVAERRAKCLFPKKKERFWYCGEFFDYQHGLYQQGKPWKSKEIELPCETFLINLVRDAEDKMPEVGDILPCIKLNGWVGFYEVTKKWRYSSAGSDFASWDDGYEINLKLHHCEKCSEA
ncbi:hypothetical protein ES703_60307 [subsurface metagenome]